MNKYKVIVPINMYGSIFLTINAESEEEAKTKAKVDASFSDDIVYYDCEILEPHIDSVKFPSGTDIED